MAKTNLDYDSKNAQDGDDDRDVISFEGTGKWRFSLGKKTSWFKSLIVILTGAGFLLWARTMVEQFIKLWERP